MKMSPTLHAAALAISMMLAGCTMAPSQSRTPAFDAVAAVAAIRAAGAAGATELDVQPLRDSQVEDLRQQAAALEARRAYRAAATALDRALAINPDDTALLQERAEAALLLHALDDAQRHAERAFATGSKVGPLCRRHWETIAQVRAAKKVKKGSETLSSDAPASVMFSKEMVSDPLFTPADARRQRDACTVTAPNRF